MRIFPSLVFLGSLLLAVSARATTVTATVHDPNNNPYTNGTASAYTVASTGQAASYTSPVATNSNGAFSMTLAANTYIFTVCAPPTQLGPSANPTPKQVCFTSQPIAISGTSQDISSTLNAVAVVLGPNLGGTTSVAGGLWLSTAGVAAPSPVATSTCPGNPVAWYQDGAGTYHPFWSINTTQAVGSNPAGTLIFCYPTQFTLGTSSPGHTLNGIFNVNDVLKPTHTVAMQENFDNGSGDSGTYTTDMDFLYSEYDLQGSPNIGSNGGIFLADHRITFDDFRTGGSMRGGMDAIQGVARKQNNYDNTGCDSAVFGSCWAGGHFGAYARPTPSGHLGVQTFAGVEAYVGSQSASQDTTGVGYAFRALTPGGGENQGTFSALATQYGFYSEDQGSCATCFNFYSKGSTAKNKFEGPLILTAYLAPANAQTSVNCSTSGTVVFSQPLQGASDKKVLAVLSACLGTASYTYPTAFSNTPDIFAGAGVTSSLVSAVSTTAMTITGTTSTGVIILESY